MNNIQIFSSPQFGDIRVAGSSEQPLFCLVDICKPLGLDQISRVKSNLDEDGVTHTYTRQDGTIDTSMLTVWTETGRQFIHSLFKS